MENSDNDSLMGTPFATPLLDAAGSSERTIVATVAYPAKPINELSLNEIAVELEQSESYDGRVVKLLEAAAAHMLNEANGRRDAMIQCEFKTFSKSMCPKAVVQVLRKHSQNEEVLQSATNILVRYAGGNVGGTDGNDTAIVLLRNLGLAHELVSILLKSTDRLVLSNCAMLLGYLGEKLSKTERLTILFESGLMDYITAWYLTGDQVIELNEVTFMIWQLGTHDFSIASNLVDLRIPEMILEYFGHADGHFQNCIMNTIDAFISRLSGNSKFEVLYNQLEQNLKCFEPLCEVKRLGTEGIIITRKSDKRSIHVANRRGYSAQQQQGCCSIQ